MFAKCPNMIINENVLLLLDPNSEALCFYPPLLKHLCCKSFLTQTKLTYVNLCHAFDFAAASSMPLYMYYAVTEDCGG